MFTDFQITAPDEATALAAAHQAGQAIGLHVVQQDEETGELRWITSGPRHFLKVRGAMIDTPAVTDEEGNVLTEATYLDGWFAMLRVRDDIGQQVAAAIEQADPHISVTQHQVAVLT